MLYNKLLIKCDNTAYADEITGVLSAKGIASRRNDKTHDAVAETKDDETCIAVYVSESDYEKAQAVIASMKSEGEKLHLLCPKCGSEDVIKVPLNIKKICLYSILSILCSLFPMLCILLPDGLIDYNKTFDVIVILMLLVGIIFLIKLFRSKNYECRKCGKKFYHKD